MLEQYYPSNLAGMTVAGSELDRFRGHHRTMLSFNEAQEPMRTEPLAGEFATIGKAMIYSSVHIRLGTDLADHKPIASLPQLDTELAKEVEFVEIAQRGRTVQFETKSLADVFIVLNTCTTDMVKEWGLDVDRHLTASRMPQWTNVERIAKQLQRAYPLAAAERGEQAIVRLRAIIDETGQVEHCVLEEATTTEKLKSPACDYMDRAKFEPALDADGNPFRSYYGTVIMYQIAG